VRLFVRCALRAARSHAGPAGAAEAQGPAVAGAGHPSSTRPLQLSSI
jgi:hypothetical protein